MTDFEPLLEGLTFPEGPRWHKGRLWFSDMHDQSVLAVDANGNVERVLNVPNSPSGLGWQPDGSLLIVSMKNRKLLKYRQNSLLEFADLSGLASWHCNDMVVDSHGRAFVGNFGFDLYADTPKAMNANLIRVDLDGSVHLAAPDLMFPNGTVITPDGRTLIIGESWGARLTAFDIDEAGGLSNRREWAALSGCVPDGICLDAEGGVWLASPVSSECVRVLEGGEVTHRLKVKTQAFACMLGGADGRTLFVCTAEESHPEKCVAARSGQIEVAQVDVPHAGLP